MKKGKYKIYKNPEDTMLYKIIFATVFTFLCAVHMFFTCSVVKLISWWLGLNYNFGIVIIAWLIMFVTEIILIILINKNKQK